MGVVDKVIDFMQDYQGSSFHPVKRHEAHLGRDSYIMQGLIQAESYKKRSAE